jgi:two-component system, OmpR family, response regulator
MARMKRLPRPDDAAPRILSVDADETSRARVVAALEQAGYETCEAASAEAAEQAVEDFEPALILLETALPDGDGRSLARRLVVRRPGTRLVFLTAQRRVEDKVAGLALADDYLVKPVNPLELLARLRAILRRLSGQETILRAPGLILNSTTREVRWRDRPVALTPREFDLLRLFMLNPGRVLSKQEIVTEVWRDTPDARPEVVETYVGYLRRKLDAAAIQTVRLAGYSLSRASHEAPLPSS